MQTQQSKLQDKYAHKLLQYIAICRRKMNLDASAPMYMYLFLRDVGQDGQVTTHQLKTLIFKLQFQWKK